MAGRGVMEAFVLSAVLSFIVYECLAYVDVPPRGVWFRIGQITISFDPTSAKWAQRALMALIVVAILLCILFLHEVISPLDQISRNKINIILGFLFGPLFAIWLNGVFSYPPGKPLRGADLRRSRSHSVLPHWVGRYSNGESA
jgi:hypothetical protein